MSSLNVHHTSPLSIMLLFAYHTGTIHYPRHVLASPAVFSINTKFSELGLIKPAKYREVERPEYQLTQAGEELWAKVQQTMRSEMTLLQANLNQELNNA
jgi:hypothetical protein